MSKSTIISKAMRCVDEVYAGVDTATNEELFTYSSFIMEAVRWVVDMVPLRHLGDCTKDLELSDYNASNGVGGGNVSGDFGRLLYIKAADWKRKVTSLMLDTDPRYAQQSDIVLRGNPARPVAVLCEGGNRMELYTTSSTSTPTGEYVPYDADRLPAKLEDITAWKLAEIVLMSINDTASATICAARVNDILNQLQS